MRAIGRFLNSRTARKLRPEAAIAVLSILLAFAAEDPKFAAAIGPTGMLLLQATRRAVRDRAKGSPD